MSEETQRALAEYKAQVDAKYATVRERHEATLAKLTEPAEARKKDDWLLISPDGRIDGVLKRYYHPSATEAFELFFPKKKERLKAAADGWHIRQDDENGSGFEEFAASYQSKKATS